MVAEGGGVAPHPGQQLQLAASLADGGSERGPHAVVAGIEHQHRTLPGARRFPLRDQGGQTREPAPGLVVVERERGVVRGRRHPDQIGVQVVGVQDGEGLLPVRCRRLVAPRRTTIAPIATEPASTSRREGALPDRPVFVPFEALACFTVAGCFIAIAFEIWRVRLEPAVRHISDCIAR